MLLSRITNEEQAELNQLPVTSIQRLSAYPELKAPPQPDLELIAKAREWVLEQDKLSESKREWDQGSWFQVYGEDLNDAQREKLAAVGETNVCRTHACVAGHVALMFGEALVDHADTVMDVVRNDEDGLMYRMPNLATRKLGLTVNQAATLFEASNDAEQVVAILDRVMAAARKKEQKNG